MNNLKNFLFSAAFILIALVLFGFELVDPFSAVLGAGAILAVYGLVMLVRHFFLRKPAPPIRLNEETEDTQAIIKVWYEKANSMTLAELPTFVRRLVQDYQHDYGTICHAMTAASLAAAHAVNSDPQQGGITGFQASCVMWGFIEKWSNLTGPARMLRYEDLLFPQYVPQFQAVISEDVARWLKEQAQEKLKGEMCSCCPEVKVHWEMLAEGKLPEGIRAENF